MDPLSIAASIITLVQLTSKVSSICLELYGSLGARKEVDVIIDEVDALRRILHTLVRLTSAGTDYDKACANSALPASLADCKAELESLAIELGKVRTSKLPGVAIPWLLKEKEVTRRLERLSRVKQTLQLSLTADHTYRAPAQAPWYTSNQTLERCC